MKAMSPDRRIMLVIILGCPLVVILIRSWIFAAVCLINRWFDITFYNALIIGIVTLLISSIMYLFARDYIKGDAITWKKKIIYMIGWFGLILVYTIFLLNSYDNMIGLNLMVRHSHRPQKISLDECKETVCNLGKPCEEYYKIHHKYPEDPKDYLKYINDPDSGTITCPGFKGVYKYYVSPDRRHCVIYCSKDAHKWAGVPGNNPAWDSKKGLVLDNQINEGNNIEGKPIEIEHIIIDDAK